MRKNFILHSLLVTAGMLCLSFLASCNKGGKDSGQLENQFASSGDITDIMTVGCVEEDGTYTIYISPTSGINGLDAMIEADDYIMITTSSADGDVDLLADGNSLSYKDYVISGENQDNVVSSSLYVKLDNGNAEISLESELSSGESLDIEYNGKYINFESEIKEPVVLDKTVLGLYMGRKGDIDNYYLVMSNAEFETSGSSYELKSEGYALQLDIYSVMGDSWIVVPDGEYSEATDGSDHTYSKRYTGVVCRDAEGNTSDPMPLSGPLSIAYTDGIYTISTSFIDENNSVRQVSFTGSFKLKNDTFKPILPQIEDDVFVEGFAAEAIYQGNILQTGAGLMEINIYDFKFDNHEVDGLGITVVVFSDLFKDPKNCRIMPGEYIASSSCTHSTWMIAQEIDFMGMIFPLGTYVQMDDGTDYGKFCYGASGKVTITDEGEEGFGIECDLVSADGYTIKATYKGKIPVTDMSDDNPDDGSSTLEKDLEMDLNYIPAAYCYPQTTIYADGVGDVPVSDIPNFNPPGQACGYQFIEIGRETGEYDSEGTLMEGDIIRLDLLVEPGQEGKITLGKYEITDGRFPADFKPGVAPRGYQGVNGNLGTRWEKIGNAIGNADIDGDGEVEIDVPLNIPSVKGYACVYSGTITIEKADGGENWYTFTIDGKDVLEHKITGSWTGPVYLPGGTTPVLPSETKEFAGRRLPIVKDLVSRQ